MRLPLSDLASPAFRSALRAGARRECLTSPRSLLRALGRSYMPALATALGWLLLAALGLRAQQTQPPGPSVTTNEHATQFLTERLARGTTSAEALVRAHRERGLLPLQPLPLQPQGGGSFTAAWQPLGPPSVASASYGNVSGRVTSVALDPNDATGNTLYVGTTGGGVWKSTNAASALGAVTFTPLTDVLPVFTANAGGSTIASLSIGAVAVQPLANPVVLAGTGDPNDATDSYYGEGILRSADGGLTWTLAQGSRDGANGQHSFLGLGVAGFAFSTATPSLVVAALSNSAEGAIVNAGNIASVAGLYYSTDAGLTWQMATVYDGAQLVQTPQPVGTVAASNPATSVVWNPLRQRFYAALRLHGFYESADGITWHRLGSQPGTGLTATACPAVTSSSCPIFRGVLAVQPATGDMYALSVDTGLHDNGLWQDICAAAGLACAAGEPAFAQRIDGGALEAGSGSTVVVQGDYNLTLAAAPAPTGTTLFAGTIDLYRCTIAAGTSICALRNTTNALNGCAAPAMVAPAQHALALKTLGPGAPIVFVGNDGGLYRSLDGVAETGSACNSTDAQHFDNLNAGLGSLAETAGFAQAATDPDTLLAGLGANGTAFTSAAAASQASHTPWTQVSAGEGGFPLLDPANPLTEIIAVGAGVQFKQCTRGASCTAADFAGAPNVGAAQVSGDAALLDAPVLLDPALSANLVTGTCRVWRGPASGGGWSAADAISPAFGGGSTPCTSASAFLRSLAAGGPVSPLSSGPNAGSTVLYAGMAGVNDGGGSVPGHLFVTTAGATATSTTPWTDAARSPVTNDIANASLFNPAGFDVSSVTIDTHDPTGGTVYATIMGFGSATAAVPHVYRSIDFGAHWLNVTANLPDAPANALVVDPNDANTVYIALDTGVYATAAIATCASANCWSLLGTGLPNAPVTTLAAGAGLPTGDGRKGLLRAGTYGRGLWSIPLLTAQSTAQPAITVSSASIAFAAQAVATQSPAQSVTLTSSGNAPVVVSTVALTGDFSETDTCAGQTLAAGASCSVQITFAPSVPGPRNGTLTLYANVAGGQVTVALTGTGTAPAAITINPVALKFAATLLNQTSATQNVTIANTGGTGSPLAPPVITGDFYIAASSCSTTLAPQTACTVSVAFTPTVSGNRTGTLTFTDSAGTQTATLSGSGSAPATDTLSASALNFGATQIGTASATQPVTLTNAGDVPLLLVSASVAAGPFTATNTCSASLAAHTSCVITVAFVPTLVGSAAGTLTFTDQFRTQTIALSGLGIAPAGVSLTPVAGLSFSAAGVGFTTPLQALTLTNNGGATLAITSTTVSGDFHLVATTCAATLAPAAACTLQIVFAPTAAGTRSGTVTLVDNAPGSPQAALLVGTGVDFSIQPAGPISITVTSGSSATYPMLLNSMASVNATAALGCAGAPAHSTCVVSPTNVSLSGTVSFVVTVQTGLASVELRRPGRPFFERDLLLPIMACVLPLGLFARKRRKLPSALLPLLLLAALTSTQGCGSGRLIPADGSAAPTTPTPPGTYALTVTGVAAGVSHSVNLTLVVQ